MSSLAGVVRSEVTIVAFGQVLQQVLTLFTGVLIARMLGSAGYGVINLLRAIFAAVTTVAPLGLDLAILKFFGQSHAAPERFRETFWYLRLFCFVFNVFVALAVGLLLGGPLEQDVFKHDQFALMLLITLLSAPLAADLAILGAFYKASGRAGTYAILTLYLQPVARVVMVSFAALFSPTALTIVCINAIQVTLSGLATAAHYAASPPSLAIAGVNRKRSNHHKSEMWRVLRESVWMTLNLFISGMMRFVDIMMLGSFASAKDVGEYGAVTTVAQLVQVYPFAASQRLGPTISQLYHSGDIEGVRHTLSDYIRKASMIAAFVFAGVAVFGTRLDLLFGPTFQFREDVCFLVPLGYLLSATLAPTGYALSMTGRHRAELAIIASGGGMLVLLCALLIPSFGQVGAAASVTGAFAFVNLIRFAYVGRVLDFVPGHPRDLIPPLAALALAYGARSLGDHFGERSLLTTAASCVLFATAYLIFIWVNSAFGAKASPPGRDLY